MKYMEKREIKFRVWEVKNKKWFEPIYEAYKGNLYDLSITLSGEVIVRTSSANADMTQWQDGDFEVSQYTGLKDKKGKEIYEGDVLFGGSEGHQRNRVVKWTDQNAAYFVISNSAIEKVDWDDCLTEERIRIFNYEILGNIYQNPDLLS